MGTHTTQEETTTHNTALECQTYTVTETAKLLGISRSTAYECVRTGELRSLRFRSRIVIPHEAIADILATGNRPASG